MDDPSRAVMTGERIDGFKRLLPEAATDEAEGKPFPAGRDRDGVAGTGTAAAESDAACGKRGESMPNGTSDAVEELTFWGGVRDCVPTLLGYWSIGFAAGVVGATAGFNVLEIGLLSVFLYAGSAQFIVAAMASAGSSIISIIVTVFFVNVRHLLLSAAIAPLFRPYSVFKNFLLGVQLTDETFGVAVNRLSLHANHRDKWMFGLNVTAQLNWVIATLAGAWFGAWIPDPERFGLHFALPAMFVGLVVQQIMHRKQWRTDLIVAGTTVAYFAVLFLWLPSHIAVILAAVGAACTGLAVERWR